MRRAGEIEPPGDWLRLGKVQHRLTSDPSPVVPNLANQPALSGQSCSKQLLAAPEQTFRLVEINARSESGGSPRRARAWRAPAAGSPPLACVNSYS